MEPIPAGNKPKPIPMPASKAPEPIPAPVSSEPDPVPTAPAAAGPTVLRITVTDSGFKPAAGASILVEGPGGAQRTVTDAKGIAEFRTNDMSMPKAWIEQTVTIKARSGQCETASASADTYVAAGHQAVSLLQLPACGAAAR